MDNTLYNLDGLFSKPIPHQQHLVEVVFDPTSMLDQYVNALLFEMERVSPNQWNSHPIEADALKQYLLFLLDERVLAVRDACKNWRLDKQLWIPSSMQYVLSQVGEVYYADRGLTITCKKVSYSAIDIQEALDFNQTLMLYAREMKSMHQDAFPRGKDGDPDFMSTAVIEGVVRSFRLLAHPATTLVTAFAGMSPKVVDGIEADDAYKVRYDQQYDEVAYIKDVYRSRSEVLV